MPARRKTSDIRIEFGPVRVFLDDLEEIDGAVRGGFEKVLLEADEYELDTVAEIGDVPGTGAIRSVIWRAYGWEANATASRSVVVHLAPNLVYASGDPAFRGELGKVEDVLRRRHRRLAGLLIKLWLAPCLVFAVLVTLVLGAKEQGYEEALPFLYAAAILSVLWWYFAIWWMPRHQTVILRCRSIDRLSFWRRNRDLWVALVPTIIGSVLAAGLTYLLTGR